MKQFIAFSLLVICIFTQSFFGLSRPVIYPTFDASSAIVLPRNLRTTQCLPELKNDHFNFSGLNHLKASGSGQFSEESFIALRDQLSVNFSQIIVFDLRQESHGLINGVPISWTDGLYNYANINKTKTEIETDEKQRLQLAMQAGCIIINPVEKAAKLIVQSTKTERELVESLGSTYIRLPVTDHNRPSDEILDQFIELVNKIPADQWLHFHCKGGKGRTTTFLTLLDIIKNANQVSLEDILARQQVIGGVDLVAGLDYKTGEKKRAAEERLELIKRFYAYCCQVPNFAISWSTWLEQQAMVTNNP